MMAGSNGGAASELPRWTSFWVRGIGPFREKAIFQLREKAQPDGAEIHIFTGENGTGKSTLLRCFAGLFDPGYGPLSQRVHPPSLQEVLPNGTYGFQVFLTEHISFGTAYLSTGSNGALASSLLTSPWPGPILDASGAQSEHLLRRYPCFGYAGGRNLRSVELAGIVDLKEGPLQKAMSFESTVSSERLVQWVASVFTKEALAARKGKTDKADQYRQARERIHKAMSEVVGQPVTFELEDEPVLRVQVMLGRRQLGIDALPDGVKSILSWLADLLMRLDRIPWEDKSVDPLAQPFALFLDEIDAHLHPAWQRKVLPMVQRLFPRAQVFVATHSPFVVASVAGAWVHRLVLNEDGSATNREPVPSRAGYSYETVLEEDFGIIADYDDVTEAELAKFRHLKMALLAGKREVLDPLRELATQLLQKSPDLRERIGMELRQIQRVAGIEVLAMEPGV
ncbi:MAG TPA: AAA family ATPase [Polyangia bacterium]|jgi:energy-coupling factor transporter ATP-binding protein EcfA2|nr:AAA family ATPase [Polyangia bacterium]